MQESSFAADATTKLRLLSVTLLTSVVAWFALVGGDGRLGWKYYIPLAPTLMCALAVEFVARRVGASLTARSGHVAELERLALAAQSSPAALVVTDADRRILWVNDAFTRITGYTSADVVGGHPGAFLQSDRTAQDTITRMRDAIRGCKPVRVEVLNRHKLGHVYWADLDIQPYFDPRGRPAGFVSAQADITTRKMESLHMQTILQSMPVGFVTHNVAGQVVDCNVEACRILDMDQGWLVGSSVSDYNSYLVSDDGSAMSYEESPAITTLKSGRPIRGAVVGIRRRDDPSGYRWIRLDTELLRDPVDGGLSGVVSIIADITEQRDAATRLRMATASAEAGNRAKSTFLASMSHELRTPMNGILGLVDELIARDPAGEGADLLKTIKKSGVSLMRLLNDILDISKIEAGRMDIERSDFCVAELLESARGLYESRAREKNIELSTELALGTPPSLVGDPFRLRQIVLNLVSNAVKFTSHGGVRICARHDGERIHIDVIDTGIGMSPAVADRVFEQFYQAETGAQRRPDGTGLGLAISRRLARAMGGDVTVTSSPGAGSRFSLVVPAPPSSTTERQKASVDYIESVASTSNTPPSNLPKLVLLVEDNPVNQKVAQMALRRLGIVSIVANHGAEALEKLETERVDLVLMDCHMPVMDGFEATRRIRALPDQRASLPVVALTAALFEDEKRAMLEVGMDAIVAKPLQLAGLRAAMGRAVEERRASSPTSRGYLGQTLNN